jgi:diguanylate cyclase (GGDEF)-like protein/PAS domain S-box-containing protein
MKSTLERPAWTGIDVAEQQWRLALEAAPHGIALVELDGTMRHVNDALCRTLGYSAAELRALTFLELTHPDDRNFDAGNVRRLLDGELDKVSMIKRYRHADGHWVWASVSVGVVRDPFTGVPVHFVATVEDIGDRIARHEEAARDSARHKAILDAQIAIAGVQLTPEAVREEICARAMTLTGADGAVLELPDGDQMLYQVAVGSMAPHRGHRVPRVGNISGRCVSTGRSELCDDTERGVGTDLIADRRLGVRSMIVVPMRSGEQVQGVLKVVSASPARFSREDQGALELLGAPFGAALANAEQLENSAELARTDPLTGLGNRNHAEAELDRALRRQARSGEHTVVMFLDLDGFKAVNDERGHDTGDIVLALVAERIWRTLRDTDTAARFGGDEFLIVAEAFDGVVDAQHLAHRLIAAISEPYELPSGPPVRIGVSIGIAVSEGATSAAMLLREADAAMYESKRKGGGCTTVHYGGG